MLKKPIHNFEEAAERIDLLENALGIMVGQHANLAADFAALKLILEKRRLVSQDEFLQMQQTARTVMAEGAAEVAANVQHEAILDLLRKHEGKKH